MKKLTLFTALSLSLFMLASCGKDKKKKNNDLTISGIINPQSCYPQGTNGAQIPQDLANQIMQACNAQKQHVMNIASQRYGQPVYFTATYVQDGYYNPYNTGMQNPQLQQQWGGQVQCGGNTQWGGQQWMMNPQQQQAYGGTRLTSFNPH